MDPPYMLYPKMVPNEVLADDPGRELLREAWEDAQSH